MKEYIIINHLIGSKAGEVEGFLISNFSEITIGRDPSSIIRFDRQKDVMISSHHAKIIISGPNHFSIVDLNSRNGTFINKRRIFGATRLKVGDIIQAGLDGSAFEFDLKPRPASSNVSSSEPLKRIVIDHLVGSKTGQRDYISLNDFRELTFGRSDNSMIKYDPYQEYMLSREQAKITPNPKNPGQFIITDLDSLNGTYINKAKLLGSLPLKSGDIIQFSTDGPVFKFSIK